MKHVRILTRLDTTFSQGNPVEFLNCFLGWGVKIGMAHANITVYYLLRFLLG